MIKIDPSVSDLATTKIIVRYGLEESIGIQAFVSELGGISGEVTNQQVTEMFMGLMVEVGELAQEVGWKSWKDNPTITEEHVEKVAGEWADCLAFFLICTKLTMDRFDLSSRDLVTAYLNKSKTNVLRFKGESGEEGYTGVK